ncbi:MAG TPA: MtrB/PioB family outer membrane beta-barrel protein, partial [Dehalococcoidia bacterium]|nr:MtrB/PioB family outer membrane beta-barrel protein [Dehalococcoidia bacterium]
MRSCATLLVRLAIPIGVMLLIGAGAVLAGEPTGAEWKKDLPFDLTGEIEAGLQVVQPRGSDPSATFDEYRDLPRTDEGGWWGHLFQVPSFRLLGEDKARTRFLEIGGTNLTRMDANYYMNAGLYNYLRFNFEFDRIPHVISHSAQTIYNEVSPGVFQIPGGAVGSGLAGALNAVASTPTAAQRTAVVNRVNALLHPTELGFQSDSARL